MKSIHDYIKDTQQYSIHTKEHFENVIHHYKHDSNILDFSISLIHNFKRKYNSYYLNIVYVNNNKLFRDKWERQYFYDIKDTIKFKIINSIQEF